MKINWLYLYLLFSSSFVLCEDRDDNDDNNSEIQTNNSNSKEDTRQLNSDVQLQKTDTLIHKIIIIVLGTAISILLISGSKISSILEERKRILEERKRLRDADNYWQARGTSPPPIILPPVRQIPEDANAVPYTSTVSARTFSVKMRMARDLDDQYERFYANKIGLNVRSDPTEES